MLRPRIIPCLLVKRRRTRQDGPVRDAEYVGDPLNAVRIFNEKEVDELIVLDIDATATAAASPTIVIQNLAAECRMPLCYGGGVKTLRSSREDHQSGRREGRRSAPPPSRTRI